MQKFSGVTVRQIYTGCLAQAAYYLESGGEAAVIDPMREAGPYLELLREDGARLRYVFETHFHADFVSGHLDLARATGAAVVYGPGAAPAFPARIARDGEEFALGSARLRVLHTPGHTLESVCYLLIDAEGRERALFTGDTLFLGDVGRPDLAVRSDKTPGELADLLFESLRAKILPLPDAVTVYPGHGAGSACGRHMSRDTVGTLGAQKETNPSLRHADAASFRAEVLSGLAPAPKYFSRAARLNREGYDALVPRAGAAALDAAAFAAIAERGDAVILDVRDPATFSRGFVPGSVNIGLDGAFAPWAGALLPDPRQPLLLVCPPGREEETVARLARIGLQNIAGLLEGGVEAWRASGRAVDAIPNLSAEDLARELAEGGARERVIDLRRPAERAAGAVPGSRALPLEDLNKGMQDLRPDEVYRLHCASGYRSMIAASILKARGFGHVTNVEGGFKAIEPALAASAGGAR